MPTKNVRIYTVALIIVDILAVLTAITIAYTLRVKLDPRPITVHIHAIEFFLVFVRLLPVWLLTFWVIGMYAPRNYEKRQFEIGRLAVGSAIGVLLIIGYAYFTNHHIFPTRIVPIYAALALFALLVIGRELLRFMRKIAHHHGYDVRRVIIVGSGAATADLIKTLGKSGRTGYKVVAVVGSRTSDAAIERFNSLDKALGSLDRLRIDVIIQTSLYDEAQRNQVVMSAALEHHIQYSFIPGEAEFYSGKNQIDVFMGYPIINVYHTPLIGWGKFVKQISDLFFTLITLPVWGLVVVVIAVLQKFLNPGPVFYSSRRLTRYSKAFGLLKFRTMGAQYGLKDAAEEFRDMGREDLAEIYEVKRKVEDDPRITKFGKFLRTTSLDELPQLFNVLKGDISLVGPRPILPQELHLYHGRGALLHSVKSGLTGLWQVSGRSKLSFNERVELELYYAQNWSMIMDLKIILKTIWTLLTRHGAH